MALPALKTGHVGLNVTELEPSLAFYKTIFEFDVLAQRSDTDGRNFALLGDKDAGVVVALWEQSGGQFANELPGLHHLSFQVESIDEVREAEANLKSLGVEFAYDGIVPHGEGASSGGIFFTDPDGIRLEIFAPTGAEVAEAPVSGAPTCGFF